MCRLDRTFPSFQSHGRSPAEENPESTAQLRHDNLHKSRTNNLSNIGSHSGNKWCQVCLPKKPGPIRQRVKGNLGFVNQPSWTRWDMQQKALHNLISIYMYWRCCCHCSHHLDTEYQPKYYNWALTTWKPYSCIWLVVQQRIWTISTDFGCLAILLSCWRNWVRYFSFTLNTRTFKRSFFLWLYSEPQPTQKKKPLMLPVSINCLDWVWCLHRESTQWCHSNHAHLPEDCSGIFEGSLRGKYKDANNFHASHQHPWNLLIRSTNSTHENAELRMMKLTAELYLMLRYRNPHKVEDILLQKQWVFVWCTFERWRLQYTNHDPELNLSVSLLQGS